MNKRRLTERQQRQISANKELQASRHGGDTHTGIVVTHHGKKLVVRNSLGQDISCEIRQNLGTIVCGDRVVYQYNESDKTHTSGIVVATTERSNLLQKSGFGGQAKTVAANIDQVLIVCSLVPKPNSYLIDRYLVATETMPARPVLVINKIDLLDETNEHVVDDINTIYEKIGYRVLEISATKNTGIDELQAICSGSTSILVGLSGVGKSSLVKDLLPDVDIRIGEISNASKEGKHTTTVSTLYALPTGGNLIDSPGVRDFSPVNLDRQTILDGFIELKPYRGLCKFANCTHIHEPGCAIIDALEQGEVSRQRVESFRKMLADSED